MRLEGKLLVLVVVGVAEGVVGRDIEEVGLLGNGGEQGCAEEDKGTYIWQEAVLQRGDLLVDKSQALVCCRSARLGLLDLHGGICFLSEAGTRVEVVDLEIL